MPDPHGRPNSAPVEEASMMKTCGIALVATVITCAAIMPFHKVTGDGFISTMLRRTYEIVIANGYYVISPGTIFLSYWALAMLAYKISKVKRDAKSLLLDPLPTTVGATINRSNVDNFLKHISTLPIKPGESTFIDRVRGALEHYKISGSREETDTFLKSQHDMDGSELTQSYTMINVLSWAIPILGFIGTVVGIAMAVTGFSHSIEGTTEISVLKQAIGGVTAGLAVAFDTTLIGLLLSLVVVFPAKLMEKREEESLAAIEEYTTDALLKRLESDTRPQQAQAQQETSKEWVKNAVAAAMAAQEGEFKLWTKHLRESGEALSQQALTGWQTIQQQMQESLGLQMAQLKVAQEEQVKQLAGGINAVSEMAMKTQQQVAGLQEAQLKGYKDTVAGLASNLQTIQEQSAQRSQTDAQALQQMATEFANTLGDLRNAATKEQGEWSKYFAGIGETVTGKIVEGWATIDQRMKASLEQQLSGIQTVAGQITNETKVVTEHLKAAQEAEIKRMSETMNALNERTATVQKQIAEFQESQVRGFKDAVGSLGTNLKTIQEEAHSRNEADAAALRQMVTGYVESLNSLREQSKALQTEMADTMRNSGPAFREELGRISTQVGEAFSNQLKSLDSVRQNIESGAEKFVQRVDEIRNAQVQGVAETARVLKETVQTLQKDLAVASEQPVRKLQEVAQALAESARATQKDLETAREVMREEARKAAEITARAREDANKATADQVSQISRAAEQMLNAFGQNTDKSANSLAQATDRTMSTLAQASEKGLASFSQAMERSMNTMMQNAEKTFSSLTRSMEAAQERISNMEASRKSGIDQELASLRAEREAAEKASAEHFAKIAQMANQVAASISDGQRKMGEQITALVSMMEGQDKLQGLQKTMASNLELLSTSDGFRKTLSGLDVGLNRLHDVLRDLSDKAGIAMTDSGGSEAVVDTNGGRRWWRRGRK